MFTRPTGRIGIVIVSLHPWGSEALIPGSGEIVDGYTDQPHLIRQVRQFSSRTPTQLGLQHGALHQAFNGANASGYFGTVYL